MKRAIMSKEFIRGFDSGVKAAIDTIDELLRTYWAKPTSIYGEVANERSVRITENLRTLLLKKGPNRTSALKKSQQRMGCKA
jgi:hypothetical protein